MPEIGLLDSRQRVHKADDLTVELLLDVDRDGVYAALVSEWNDQE